MSANAAVGRSSAAVAATMRKRFFERVMANLLFRMFLRNEFVPQFSSEMD